MIIFFVFIFFLAAFICGLKALYWMFRLGIYSLLLIGAIGVLIREAVSGLISRGAARG